MTEATAQKKFACPGCGGEARWDPAQKALICPFCGTVSPAQEDLAAADEPPVVEHDLLAALQAIPDDRRGWQAAKTQVRCQSCQAISVFDPARVGQRCDFCGSSALVPYEEIKESFRPESLLPMKVGENQVRDSIRRWYATRWFAPNKLKTSALTDTVKGLYIPYWTFDAQVHADWTAESGYYYYETETYRDSNGETKTRQVRKIRWRCRATDRWTIFLTMNWCRPRAGFTLRCCAGSSRSPPRNWCPTTRAFWPAGSLNATRSIWLPRPKRLGIAWKARCTRLCSGEVPGDTHRNLSVDTDYSGQTFKHILAPLWLLTYQFRTRSFQVVVNGYTGTIAGEYPKSWIKITLAVLAGIAVILTVVLLARG